MVVTVLPSLLVEVLVKQATVLSLSVAVGLMVGAIAALSHLPPRFQLSDTSPAVPSTTEETISSGSPAPPKESLQAVVEMGRTSVELNGEQLNQLIVQAIAQHSAGQTLLERSQGFQTTIADGRLKTGAVIRMADLPLDQLNPEERAWIQQAISVVPGLANQQMFLGIEGNPVVQDGQLRLGDSVSIKVGGMSLPLSAIAQQFGLSPGDLEQVINQGLQAQGIEIRSIEIVGDRIRIGS